MKAEAGRRGPLDWILDAPVTWLLTAINVGVYALLAFRTGEPNFTAATLVEMGALERGRVWEGEVWRLASAVALHGGLLHVFWNTYAGFGWCAIAERAVGSLRFGAIYAASGVGASAVSLLGHDAVSIGASGAGFGIAGLWLVLLRRRAGGWRAFRDDPAVRQLLVNLALWTLLGLVFGLRMDHFAHAGGLAFGLLTGTAFLARRHAGPWVAGATLVLALVVAAAVHPWPGRTAAESTGRAHKEAEKALDGGRPEEAIAWLNRSERYGMRAFSLYYNRALAWRELRRLDEAEADLTRALDLGPGEVDGWKFRGLVRLGKKDRAGAVADLRKSIEVAPRDWKPRAEVEEILKKLEEEKP